MTLLEALERRATSLSDRVAYRFLREGEFEQDSITFGDLRRRARAAAARLGALEGGGRGEVAILLYPQGIEFIVAFFGCLYAGVVAVPASISHRKRGMNVLRRIAEDSGARWILSTGTQLEQLSTDAADVPGLAHVPCIDIEQGSQRLALSAPCCEPDSVALLQYTSGSTGMPSGVALTHENLADNQQQMQQTFEHDDQTVFVSWLPMFHDMGLGTMLMSVWSGRPCVIMSPSVFVQNPRRWLAAISQYRGTTTLAPDFAYDLCVRRVNSKDREGLDLSCWRVAVNGSEPVRSSTIERFVEAFGPCGFRREAFSPAYGLAEATLFVCAGEARALPTVQCFARENLAHGRAVPASEPAAGSTLVSCGYPRFGTRLLIVDPETREECAPDEIGEVWLGGASVGAGYWNKELETKHTFQATTADGRGPFLRTGDLAFIHDSQLFIAGRHKDIIIVRGRNHSPQDIEDSVSTCHPALVPRRCAAFSIDSDEGEQLVLVQEVARPALRTLDATAVYRAIRSVVSANHALQTHAIVLLKPATLPRTTSGKVRRKTCREGFLDNSLPAVASWRAVARGDVAQSESAQGREAAQRADQVIHWVRQNAVELAQSYSQDPCELSAALSGALAKQGLLGMQVETRHGGLGLGHFDSARVLEQLAAVDFSLALRVGVNNYLGVQPIAKHAGAQQEAMLLSRLAHGSDFAAFALNEREDATPPLGDLQLRLTGEDPWRLSGSRDFAGTSRHATVVNIVAHHDEPPGWSAFVVACNAPGVQVTSEGHDAADAIGLPQRTIRFDATPLRRQDLLGSFGSGTDVAREAMLQMRLAVGASCIGAMKRCMQLVGAREPRRAFNGKATPNPVILSRLSSAAARVTALECLVHSIALAVDKGQAVPAEGFAACKLLGPEMLLRSIDDLMLVGVKIGHESNQVLAIYKEGSALRNFDGPPEALAESTGAAVMVEDTPLRLLLEDVLAGPAVVSWVDPVLDAVRHRMKNLKGTLARRAERWGHTRAGELTAWLALLAAVEGRILAGRTPVLEHAQTWTLAQLEHAVSAVRMGTPSETATLDADDIAATFAAYARTIGHVSKEPTHTPASHSLQRVAGTSRLESASSRDRDATKRQLRFRIISWLANRLRIPVSEVEADRSFSDHGLDSVSSVELAKSLSDGLGREVDATVVWSFATIDALADHLLATPAASTEPVPATRPADQGSSPRPRPSSSGGTQLQDELAMLEHELRSRS